jgi:adenosine deaminase
MNTTQISPEFIADLPKSDLHVHLDGSLRVTTLLELARVQGVALPSETEDGLYETVFKERYSSLGEYLKGFQYTTAVMQDEDSLERVAYELAWDNFDEGVRYIEPRFAPQLHINDDLTISDVLVAVNRGFRRAADEINGRAEIRDGKEPPFAYGIIVTALRMFGASFGQYYARFMGVHPFTPDKEVYKLASMELARAAVKVRQDHGIPIVGFDLAGQENGYPARDHWEAYHFAHQNFLKKTVHAGEAYGPESIFQAITELHAERIGHGYHLFSPWLITDPNIPDKQTYIRDLAEFIANRRITLEVCLTSNLQTNPMLKSLADHAFRDMWRNRLSVTICTDNRLVSRTTVSREIELAVTNFNLNTRDLRHIVIYGFKRSFFPGTYREKRNYVRSAIDYYEEVERRHLGDAGKPAKPGKK